MASPHPAFDGLDDERSAFLLELEDDLGMVSTASQNANQGTRLTLTGTEGRIELRPAFHGTVELRIEAGDLRLELDHAAHDEVTEMREEFDYFADRLLTGAEVAPDGRHGLRDLAIIEAVHRAAETGERQEVSP